MTIVIGLYTENFSMIATDTRIVPLDPSQAPIDNFSKLCSYGSTWIAGAGYGPLIQFFNSTLEANKITQVAEIEPVFKFSSDYLLQQLPKDEKQHSSFKNTTVLYSFSYLDNQTLKFSIDILDHEHGRRSLAMNKVVILFPANHETLEPITPSFIDLIKRSSDINELIYNTASYIKEVSSVNQWVSNICDFGLLIKERERLFLQVNVKESADTIMNNYNTAGNLMNLWNIKQVLPL